MAVQQASIVGVGRTMSEIEQSVVEQARTLAGDEWKVATVNIGRIEASDAEDLQTENGVRRMVRVWEAAATVSLTSVDDYVDRKHLST